MKIPTPKTYCNAYLDTVYDGKLEKNQHIEVSCAFYAGIEAACKFIEEHMANDEETDDEVLAKRLVRFRVLNKDCAQHTNLLRYSE